MLQKNIFVGRMNIPLLETMKDVLIVFGILLLLLILIGAFGGSIRYRENFAAMAPTSDSTEDAKKHVKNQVPPTTTDLGHVHKPEEPMVEGFDGGAYAGVPEESVEDFQTAAKKRNKLNNPKAK